MQRNMVPRFAKEEASSEPMTHGVHRCFFHGSDCHFLTLALNGDWNSTVDGHRDAPRRCFHLLPIHKVKYKWQMATHYLTHMIPGFYHQHVLQSREIVSLKYYSMTVVPKCLTCSEVGLLKRGYSPFAQWTNPLLSSDGKRDLLGGSRSLVALPGRVYSSLWPIPLSGSHVHSLLPSYNEVPIPP